MTNDASGSHRFVLFADYFQFYIQDIGTNPSADEFVETVDGTITEMISPGRGFVNFGTVRASEVPVTLCIEPAEPPTEIEAYDHVAEASVEFPTGRLIVAGLGDYSPDAAQVEVAPGSYRVRILCQGLDTLDSLGLEGNDTYTVVMWRAPLTQPRVLRRHQH